MEPAENQASPLHPHEPEIAQSIDEEGRCRVCHIMAERDELAKNLGIWASEALIRQAEVRDLKAELEKARELLGEAPVSPRNAFNSYWLERVEAVLATEVKP